MKKIFYLSLVIFVSCTNIPYRTAKETYQKNEFSKAIKQFDESIEKEGNPALKVNAKHLRSNCYYELGKQEMENENYNFAADLLFFANSNKADSLLDNCYYHLAQNYFAIDDYSQTYKYLNFICDNFENSELMANVLSDKIKIEFEIQNNPKKSYQTYQLLQNNFPQTKAFETSKNIVNKFIPNFVQNARENWHNNKVELALKELFHLHKFPADFEEKIELLIGEIHFSQAKNQIENNKLEIAVENLRKAEKFNPKLSEQIAGKLNQICNIHINIGDEFFSQRKTDEAIESYENALNVITNFDIAIQKINKTKELAKNIEEANKLILQADKFFDNKEYLRAKEIYTKAYQIDPIDTIQEKINNAISWHRITTEPEKYALDIIKNFENGIIPLKISKLEDELYKKFFRKQIKIYGWQTFRSPKFNSYEVRYSIITPEKSYFFLWVVKLESEQIIPLNKTTENLL